MEAPDTHWQWGAAAVCGARTEVALIDPLGVRRRRLEESAAGLGYAVSFSGASVASLTVSGRLAQVSLALLASDGSSCSALEEAERLRDEGFAGAVAVHTPVPSLRELDLAIHCGADYFARSRRFAWDQAIDCVLATSRASRLRSWEPPRLGHSALLRSMGLTSHELELLTLFATGFEEQVVLAQQLGTRASSVHKTFSRIVGKLGPGLGVENVAGLAHLLTRLLLRL